MSADRVTVRELIAKLSKFPPETLVVAERDPADGSDLYDGPGVYHVLGGEGRDGWNPVSISTNGTPLVVITLYPPDGQEHS